jgi:hypothetical protein
MPAIQCQTGDAVLPDRDPLQEIPSIARWQQRQPTAHANAVSPRSRRASHAIVYIANQYLQILH